MNKDFVVQLYNTIRENEEQRSYEHWNCSAIAACPREQFFKRKGVESLRSMGAGQILRRQAGHHVEAAIRKPLQIIYPELMSNKRLISDELDLSGEFDNFAPDEHMLIEIKSVHDYAFKQQNGDYYLKEQDGTWPNGNKKWVAKQEPYLNHRIQQHCLVKLLREAGYEVDTIRYVYISLSGIVCVYDTEVEDEVMSNVDKRLSVLHEAWSKNEMPDCICKIDGTDNTSHPLWESTMQFCDYRLGDECCSADLLVKEEV